MPELPEVETICRQLQAHIAGKTIKTVEVLYPKVVQGKSTTDFVRALNGRRVREIGRQGKLILIRLSGDETLVVHLKMTGRLILQPTRHPERSEGSRTNVRNAHTREILQSPRGSLRMTESGVTKSTEVIFTFQDGTRMFYDDMRRFGYMKILPTAQESALVHKEKMGIDFFDSALTAEKFSALIRSRGGSQIKTLLLDQSLVSGIGNIYAQEACFSARVHPERKVLSLDNQEASVLYHALYKIMKKAIACGGTTADDYRDAYGEKGKFALHLKVYGREGKPCLRCKTKLFKKFIGGRGTVFCPKCQG